MGNSIISGDKHLRMVAVENAGKTCNQIKSSNYMMWFLKVPPIFIYDLGTIFLCSLKHVLFYRDTSWHLSLLTENILNYWICGKGNGTIPK
ncbi:hypothetical protein Y1Q_0021180 [Alligator mississippiensis]|uniref:Uncharacterized protein n=1 Tax=Alligator mississippiensis TaxID=8496 RepID=A0A151MZX9_ALLMI|nr:hypothetical protein Y1Q_0021180 [Alligator mississippiensis]